MARRNEIAPQEVPPPRAKPRIAKLTKATMGEAKVLSLKVTPDQAADFDAAFGTDSSAFQNRTLDQVLNVILAGAKPDNDGDLTGPTNAGLAMLSGIAPEDALEGMLAAQMVVAHCAALRAMGRHAGAETLEGCEAHANMANKFMRTFTAQMEALGRHRRKGEQVVRHVHVNDGGRAVFAGTINQGRSK